MSRSGYSEDLDPWDLIKWRGQVASAIRGARGQCLIRDLLTALDAIPGKALIANELVDSAGNVCALGAVGQLRAIEMSDLDPDDYDVVARVFDIAPQLAREIVYLNDEEFARESPQQRWSRMRQWAISKLNGPAIQSPKSPQEPNLGTQGGPSGV